MISTPALPTSRPEVSDLLDQMYSRGAKSPMVVSASKFAATTPFTSSSVVDKLDMAHLETAFEEKFNLKADQSDVGYQLEKVWLSRVALVLSSIFKAMVAVGVVESAVAN